MYGRSEENKGGASWVLADMSQSSFEVASHSKWLKEVGIKIIVRCRKKGRGRLGCLSQRTTPKSCLLCRRRSFSSSLSLTKWLVKDRYLKQQYTQKGSTNDDPLPPFRYFW